jgi:hypothetical protein
VRSSPPFLQRFAKIPDIRKKPSRQEACPSDLAKG